MVKQWLNEFSSGITSGTSRAIAQLRQYRLNGLVRWHVRHIVMAIPILLQLSLALFLAGLLLLLWSLDTTVATVVSILVGLLSAFVIITTLLPLMKRGCGYLSPQALAMYAVGQWLVLLFYAARQHIYWALRRLALWVRARSSPERRSFAGAAATWTLDLLSTMTSLRVHYNHYRTWRAHEQHQVLRNTQELGIDILAMAYATTSHPDTLSIVTRCLHDSAVDTGTIVSCLEKLHSADVRQYGHFGYTSAVLFTNHAATRLWLDSLIPLLNMELAARDERWKCTLDALGCYLMSGMILPPVELDTGRAEWILTVLSSIVWNAADPLSDEGTVRLAVDSLSEILPTVMAYEIPISNTVVNYVATALSRVPEDIDNSYCAPPAP
ncbi:hypothetical protein C8Q77DRAFT_1228290 [Trametes polyzona]|nr:hypothetical protein C8Q77DRAFT_1228290 [Trametes polyzona]